MQHVLVALATLSLFAVSALLAKTIIVLYGTRLHRGAGKNDLPSVTVCIAARNETHALSACLERVLKSDYKKLEILVLDDHSEDDTPTIIKSFATEGVRFIAGQSLPPGWLGRNHAYQTLVDESSSEYVLFLDVDTTIESSTISLLVARLKRDGLLMMSVLPFQFADRTLSSYVGTLRYYWELLTSTKSHPSVASALWIVKKEILIHENTSLQKHSASVRPEPHIAEYALAKQAYQCAVSGRDFGVGFTKKISSQHETARRLYHDISGRLLLGRSASLLFLCTLITAFILIPFQPDIIPISAAAYFIGTIAFGAYMTRAYSFHIALTRTLVWPILIFIELYLLLASHISYARGSVTWKGRSVSNAIADNETVRINE